MIWTVCVHKRLLPLNLVHLVSGCNADYRISPLPLATIPELRNLIKNDLVQVWRRLAHISIKCAWAFSAAALL